MQCNLRDLALFVAAYEERSFTTAAQRENATQSGVSQHMRNLEHLLGVQLFLRERGGVTPTPAAASFYRHALKVLHAHAAARHDIARYADSPVGELRVGLMPTMTSRILAPALNRLIEEAPNLTVNVTEGYSPFLTRMVQSGELDFAIVPSAHTASGVRGKFFARTIETLVSCRDSALPHLAPVRLSDLMPLKLVLPDSSNTRRKTIEAYCAAHGVAISQIVQLDTMFGTLDFVSQSDWMTILPAVMMCRHGMVRQLTVNPVLDPEMPLELQLIEPARQPMSEPALRLVELLEEETTRAAVEWQQVIAEAGGAPASARLVAQRG